MVGRRERQREATYDEIVRVSRDLLADGAELSLRAVAARMGMTAPALYRYVGSYQELVDLVAFEIDKAATVGFAQAADSQPLEDPTARLLCACVAFRSWALANPREFTLVFANPVADQRCARPREAVTVHSSALFFTRLMLELWQRVGFPVPSLDELSPAAREAVLDPIHGKYDELPDDNRGLVWVVMEGWTTLYGVVALEVFGHLDPRVIESGDMFVTALRRFGVRLELQDDWPRLEPIVRARMADAVD
ncbi:MAG TPA: TetR-like C-terminal domain-containing protein [Jatrophihabitantaceae bacterium]|nr:TetR-like C-terminal domain-containing protein [Jatrophihabitantaceae bacterium]